MTTWFSISRAVRSTVIVISSLLAGTTSVFCQDVRSSEEWKSVLSSGDRDARRQAAIDTRNCPPETLQELLPVFIELVRHEKDGQIRLAVFDTLTQMGPAAEVAVPALAHAMRRDFGGRHNEERHQDYRAALALASIGEASVETLRNLLDAESEHIRAEAAMALGRIGPPAAAAVPDLITLLSDDSERVQQDAVQALSAVGASAIEPLYIALQDDDVRVKAAALEALAGSSARGERETQAVLQALHDESPQVRAVAVRSAVTAGISPSLLRAPLERALQDDDEHVQVAAVNLLIALPDLLRAMRPALTEMLQDEDERISWNAAFLLQETGADAVPVLLNAARDPRTRPDQLAKAIALIPSAPTEWLQERLSDDDARVRQTAALALGKMRPVSDHVIAALVESLSGSDTPEVRLACLRSISSLGARAASAVPHVRKLKDDGTAEFRICVADVLFQAAPRDQQLVDDLQGMLQGSDPEVQSHVIRRLQALGPASAAAIPAVLPLLEGDDDAVRLAAVQFLGSHGSAAQAALPALRRGLQHADAAWRVTALETLGQLGASAQPAVDEIGTATTDDEPDVRKAAIRTLLQIDLPTDQVVPYLLAGLKDSDGGVRYQAGSGIRRLGADAGLLLPELITLLDHEHAAESVTELLKRMDRYPTPKESIPRLLDLARTANTIQQIHAIRFLGLTNCADSSVADELQALADHDDVGVRDEAAAALQKLRNAAATAEP